MAMFDGGDSDFFGGMFDNGGGSGGGMSMPSTLGGGDAATSSTAAGDPYGRKSQWQQLGLYGDNGNLSSMFGVGSGTGTSLEGMYKGATAAGGQPDNHWSNLSAAGDGANSVEDQGYGTGYNTVGYSPEFLQQLGYTGGDPRNFRNGEDQGIDPAFTKYLADNNYSLQRGYTGLEGGSKQQLRAVDGSGNQKAYSEWQDDPDQMFGYALALAGGFAGAAAGGAAAGAGYGSTVGSSASNAALAESAAGTAGYGASSASIPGWVTAGGSGAGGAFGSTMVNSGGDIGQSLKAGVVGGLTGGLTAGYNPAAQVGIDDPTLQRAANGAITSGGRAALTGGNVGAAALGSLQTSALGAGLNTGYNAAFGGTKMPMEDSGMGDIFGGAGTFQPYTGGEMPQQQAYSGFGDVTDQGQGVSPMMGYQAPQQKPAQAQGTNPILDFAKSMMTQGAGGVSKPGNFDGMAGNLMQLWQSRKNSKQYGDLANGLQDLYSPNSAYAQQLNQTLMRSDAAAGRRSQVGPRNVELQARLAELNSRNAPQIASLRGMQQNNSAQQLQSLLRLGMNPMVSGGLQSLYQMYNPNNQLPAVDDYSNGFGG